MNRPTPLRSPCLLVADLISRLPWRRSFPVVLLTLAFTFSVSPMVRAIDPPPDGGYPNGNTAEGVGALFSLTSGIADTAIGSQALFKNTSGTANTATGAIALYSNTTGEDNTATGDAALEENTTGNRNTATGAQALANNTTGHDNVANGYAALTLNNTGFQNTAVGGGGTLPNGSLTGTLLNNITGSRNTATGFQALSLNQTGNGNTATGFQALINNTGSFNVAVGFTAGANLTTGSNNIDIGALGVTGESNTMRIGTVKQTRTFITGIRGVTTANANAVPVVIDSAGQLGTVSSSARFKDQIQPMDDASEAIIALKPVKFHYKSDKQNTPQFGLIAEEVAKVNPNLVVRDDNGEIYTVRYEAVNAMLLNEFLKEHKTVQAQQATITRLEKQVEALIAGLQKVSAAVELNKATTTQFADRR